MTTYIHLTPDLDISSNQCHRSTLRLDVQVDMTELDNGDEEIDFVSLGMFIIDEIEFKSHTVRDVLGGAGTYSAIGARIVSPPPLSRRVGWIVDAGSDFPAGLKSTIETWNTSCLIRETPNRLTTRGKFLV